MFSHKKILFLLATFLLSPLAFVAAATGTAAASALLTPEQFNKLSPEEGHAYIQSLLALPQNRTRATTTSTTTVGQAPRASQTMNQFAASSTNPNLMYCATYFKIGSVEVDVTPMVSSTVPGSPIVFRGVIRNDNPAPLLDGQVYVKVFYHNQKSATNVQENGYQLVDQFLAQDNITLKANDTVPVTFTWQVPQYAQEGIYEAAAYYTTSNRFNMLGLTFTDDVVGNTTAFSVVSDSPAIAYFDKNDVTLNSTPFSFAAFPPQFAKDEKVVAHVTLANPKNKETTVSVTWNLYAWDFIKQEYLRDTATEFVTLKPNERKNLSHVVMNSNDPTMLLVVEAKERDAKSVLNIRFIRTGIQEARANRLMMIQYPLRAGQTSSLFGCVHSENNDTVHNAKLTLSLSDLNGNLIHSYTYEGDIDRNVMGFKNDFVPNVSLTDFTLTARLEQQGRQPDEITLTYRCKDINPSLCLSPMAQLFENARSASTNLVVILASAILALGIWRVLTKRRRPL